MSFIVLPSTITNPQNIPVTLTADSTSPMYASLTYTFTITDLDSYVTYTVSATNGTVSRTGGTISYIPASSGTGGFTINNRNVPLTILPNPSPSYLLIGGGGGGGKHVGGGGGGGGYKTGTLTVTPGTPITVTIGAGGAGGSGGNGIAGFPGSTTTYSSDSVIGGAGGAGQVGNATTGGSSGGGGSGFSGGLPPSNGTSGLGFAGGAAGGNSAGGGGGALGIGGSDASAGGAGGDGYVLTTLYPTVTSSTSQTIGTGSFTFTVASGLQFVANQNIRIGNGSNYMYGLVTSYSGTSLVVSIYFVSGSGTFTSWTINNMFAGGGGGGGIQVYGQPGGRGGTGNVTGFGNNGSAGNAAVAGSGGGGGGGGYSQWNGGAGGDGCVIIRVSGAAQATTGSPTFCIEGAFYIYTFTASGTITF